MGIALDSFHARLNIDGEGFFYTQFGGEDAVTETDNGQGGTTKKNLLGRSKRVEYNVSPIWLLGVHFSAGFDAIKLPNAAEIKLGFSTDRAFSSGGTIEQGSIAEELRIEGVASDFFNAGLGILGVKTNVKIATFTAGAFNVINVDPATDNDVSYAERDVPLQIKYKQIDAGYDISFLFYETARRYYLEEVTLGYRYFNYTLPRVLYELRNTSSPESKNQNFVYKAESGVQNIDALYHMGGFVLRMGPGGAPRFHPYGNIGMYFGGGPVAFNMDKKQFIGSQFAFDASLALGARVRLTPKRFPLLAHAGFQWAGEILASGISKENEGGEENTQVDFGSGDFFHGIQFHLRGEI